MNLGICPNCINQLTEDSALITRPSSIFKGNNVYLMCKSCQQVLLYNKDREMIFDLDEYKDEQDVLDEINILLSEVDNHYEVTSPCQHDCSQCSGECDTQFKRASRSKPSEPVEPITKDTKEEIITDDIIIDTLETHFLAVSKADPSQKKLLTEQDFELINVNDWVFFELKHVSVEPVITYKVVRH
jgi:hypothetical protein